MAYQAYGRSLQNGIGLSHDPLLTGGGLVRSLGGWSNVLAVRSKGEREEADERVLGSSTFVQATLKKTELRQRRQLKLRLSGKTIRDIIGEECKKEDVSPRELQADSRRARVSYVRSLIAYRAVRELGLPAAELARSLGVNTSSITRSIAKMERRGP